MRNSKKQIRKELLDRLNNQARDEAFRKSSIIKGKLFSMPEFKNAKIVMLYVSMSGEVDTGDMIDEALRAGKRVALPRCRSQETIVPKEISDRKNDLEKSIYGIYEPKKHKKDIKPETIDLFVVPGVAFDKENRRLGRGKGYYDKFLGKLPPGKLTIGLAFDLQMTENLPCDSHDIPVSKIITN
ncbi:MAG: 5-formyltetrahydrofolate cyclo-ligase [Omnitrophica bacterium]|nr:5-formyltetrahydrofolate cyclo-ligase [Candidatus Omnitrophota bacterium]